MTPERLDAAIQVLQEAGKLAADMPEEKAKAVQMAALLQVASLYFRGGGLGSSEEGNGRLHPGTMADDFASGGGIASAWKAGGRRSAEAAPAVRLSAAILAAILSASFGSIEDALGRDLKQRSAFRRDNPCPATGKRSGPCPGYVVDHIRPLCAGGPDHPSNMQWLTVAEAREKDRPLIAECRRLRAGRKSG
jgi:hypothetical protein